MDARHAKSRRIIRGAVMSEMVVALPFFFVVLSLVLFLGRGVMRLQESYVADRYEAWREAAMGAGPRADAAGTDQLSAAFFRSQTSALDYQGDDYYPPDSMQALVGAVGAKSTDANNLMSEVNSDGNMDQGRRVVLTSHFAETNTIWAQLNHPVTHGHVRIGTEWKFANGWTVNASDSTVKPSGPGTHVDTAVNTVFVKGFDNQISAVIRTDPEPMLASAIQHLYTDIPGYAGPNFSKP